MSAYAFEVSAKPAERSGCAPGQRIFDVGQLSVQFCVVGLQFFMVGLQLSVLSLQLRELILRGLQLFEYFMILGISTLLLDPGLM